MRISDWSSDVCSSDLPRAVGGQRLLPRDAGRAGERHGAGVGERDARRRLFDPIEPDVAIDAAVFVPILLDLDVKVESEEHTSELQSLMRISYAVFCLKKKKK